MPRARRAPGPPEHRILSRRTWCSRRAQAGSSGARTRVSRRFPSRHRSPCWARRFSGWVSSAAGARLCKEFRQLVAAAAAPLGAAFLLVRNRSVAQKFLDFDRIEGLASAEECRFIKPHRARYDDGSELARTRDL